MIAGVGPGLGSALCRAFHAAGHPVGALARSAETLAALEAAGITGIRCDLEDPEQVDAAIGAIQAEQGPTEVLIHNAARLIRGPFLELSPSAFEQAWRSCLLTAVHTTARVLPGMVAAGRGTVLFTGATASVRGSAGYAPFAAAKFAQRALAQSLARELGPAGIHVAHVVLDGLIDDAPVSGRLRPDDVASIYLALHRQPPSAWSHELDLRPPSESW